jgi:hypothetical protein
MRAHRILRRDAPSAALARRSSSEFGIQHPSALHHIIVRIAAMRPSRPQAAIRSGPARDHCRRRG